MFLTCVCVVVITICLWVIAEWYRAGGRNIKEMQVPAIIGVGIALFLVMRDPAALLIALAINVAYDFLVRGKRIKR
jgi:predicted membrane chloride channel (bestrophin family)